MRQTLKPFIKFFNLFCLLILINHFSNAQHKQHLNQIKISDDLYYEQITDSIYMITHYFPRWGGNNLFVLLPNNKGVLIDTPYENTGTETLLNWITKNFGELELTAIVTGYHQDNLGGNELLISNGINVYGADLTKKLVLDEGDSLLLFIQQGVKNNKNPKYLESYQNLNLIPPNKTFPINEGIKLSIENEVFEVYFPGESHTIDNTVVYLHNKKVLFGGCMFKGKMYNSPGLLKFANIDEWPIAVDNTIERFPDCEIVVPGHGDYGDTELLTHMSNVLKNWKEKSGLR